MMTIGILTYWWSRNNYGQILQAYALQAYLNAKGQDAFLFRYIPPNATKKNRIKLESRSIKGLARWAIALIYRCAGSFLDRRRNFSSFREQNIRFSGKQLIPFSELGAVEVDKLVVGSDQVWNLNFLKTEEEVRAYFLDFGPERLERISYATSFGHDGGGYENVLGDTLKRFSAVSVRESSGIAICGKIGCKDAVNVVDPTQLLGAEHWSKIAKGYREKRDIFLYMLPWWTTCEYEKMFDDIRARRMSYYFSGGHGLIRREMNVWPSINKWIGLVRDSEYILTNSFHGMLFSIMFNKKFLVWGVKGGLETMNTRLLDTLKGLGLENRIVFSNTIPWDILMDDIDWKAVNSRLQSNRMQSFQYIEDNITSPGNKRNATKA